MAKRLLAGLVLMGAMALLGCARGETGDPGNATGTTARQGGRVVSDTGGTVEYWWQYGTTTAYGSASPHATIETQANTPRDVFTKLTGLQRSTTYHVRLCAQDAQQSGGPGCGQDRTFTTHQFECGDVVTQDVRLRSTLLCDESFATPGLVIGADGVDIDLAGFALRGPLQTFFDSSIPVGIDNTQGFDDLTVHNGRLDRWGQSVDLSGASRNVIRNLNTVPGHSGVRIRGGEANEVRQVSLASSRFGTALDATGTRGLIVAGSTGSRWILDATGAVLLSNTIPSGFPFNPCVSVQGTDNRIRGNTVGGCDAGGIVVRSGSGNRVVANEVSGAPEGSNVEPDGIRVEAFTVGTIVRDNVARDNADDGIDVRATGTTLTGNRATGNGDFGIDAVAGVTDGGGNTASGNGNVVQCRNVACAPAP
jgi:parallel beta-helix repeat protein